MRVFLLIFLVFFISSCVNNVCPIDNENYYCFENGGGYRLSPRNVRYKRSVVFPKIVNVKHNNSFITLKQIPDKSQTKSILGIVSYFQFSGYANYMDDKNYYNEIENRKANILFKDSLIYEIFKSKGASTENTSEDIRIREWIADSLIANDPYYKKIFSNDTNYWIIQIANDSLIGPLTKSEFEVTRKEMNIPDKLKLD